MALQGRKEPVFRLPLPRDSPGWQRCRFPTGLPRGRGRPVPLGRGSGPGAITTDSCHPMPCPRSILEHMRVVELEIQVIETFYDPITTS